MSDRPLFKWRHFQADIILCGVRWYLRYALSYRDVEALMQERGVMVDHTTIFRGSALHVMLAQGFHATVDQKRFCRKFLLTDRLGYDLPL